MVKGLRPHLRTVSDQKLDGGNSCMDTRQGSLKL